MRFAVVRNQVGHLHHRPRDRRHTFHERHAIIAQVGDPSDKSVRRCLPPGFLSRSHLDDVGIRKGGEDVPREVRDQISPPQARLDAVILLAGLEAVLTEPSRREGVGKAVFPGDLEELQRGGGRKTRRRSRAASQRRRRGPRKDVGIGSEVQGIFNSLPARRVKVQRTIVS